MKALLTALAFGGLASFGRFLVKRRAEDQSGSESPDQNATYAANQPHRIHKDVRDAGPEAMRDPPEGEWQETDEDLDESFPASDPPGGYYHSLV